MATYTRRRADAEGFEGVDKDPGRVQAGKKAVNTRKYYEGEDVMREQGRKGGEARRGSGASDDLSSMASYFHTLDTKDRRRVQAGKQAAETRRQREGEEVFREMGQKGGRSRAGRDDQDQQGQDNSTGKRSRDRDTSDRDEDEQGSGFQKRRRSLDQGKDQRRVEAGRKAVDTRKAREGEDVMREQGRKGGQVRRGRGGMGDEDEDQGQRDRQEDRHEQRVRAGRKGAAARWGKAQDDEDQDGHEDMGQEDRREQRSRAGKQGAAARWGKSQGPDDQSQDEDMGQESRHEQHVRAGKMGAIARWGKSRDDEDSDQLEADDSGRAHRGAPRQGRGVLDQGGDAFEYPDELSDEEFVDAINHNKNPNRVLAGKKTAATRRAQEGSDVFSRMGKAGAEARRMHTRDAGDRGDDQSESEHEQEVYIHRVIGGMKGARTRMEREGPDVFSRMGKAGAEARWGHSSSGRDRDDTDEGQDDGDQYEHEQEVHSHRVIGGIKAALTRKGPEVFHEMGRMGATARWGTDSDQTESQLQSSGQGRGQQPRGGSRDDEAADEAEEEEEHQSDHDREVHMHRVIGGKKGAQTMKREYGEDIHHRLGEMGARARWGR